MTINERIAAELTPRIIKFWGHTYENFTPTLVSKVMGDGQRLLFLAPAATRPNYHVVRVDSSLPEDEESELVERIFDAIENEFGVSDDGCGEDGAGAALPWPALDTSCGWSWSIDEVQP